MRFSWLSIFIILVSSLSWLPAAAQDATPEPGAEPVTEQIETQDEGESSDPPEGEPGESSSPELIEITSVVIGCGDSAATVSGSFDVANPREDVLIELQLVAGGTVLRTQTEPLDVSRSAYPFAFALEPADANSGGSVVVTAREDTPEAEPVESNAIAISATSDGGTVCGVVEAEEPTGPTVTATDEADATEETSPTVTATATDEATAADEATATAEASPTATATDEASPTATSTPETVSGTVSGTGGVGLRCRTAPVSGDIITVLAEGERIETRGEPVDGWVPVTCGGQDAWVSGDYFTLDAGTPDRGEAGSGTVVNTGGVGLRCRTSPVNGGIITVLSPGEQVETRGPASNGWVPVRCSGQDGWVSGDYFRVDSDGSDPDHPPSDGDGGFGTVVNTNGYNLRCRTSPETGATITLIPEGMRVETRGAASNGWVPVRCAGQDGWVSATYFTVDGGTTTPAPSPSAAPDDPPDGGEDTTTYGTVINTNGANLRCRTAPVDGATITLIPLGTKVETRGDETNGWVPVRCAGQDGWVSATYFRVDGEAPGPPTGPGGTPEYGMVSGTGGAGLCCRTAPVSGSIIMVLREGAQVETRGATTDGWVPVRCGGQDGWVSVAYILFDAGGGTGELWMDVNLSTQYMRVYRGNTVIMETYVSTGRPGFDTPTGTFYVNRKLPSQTMSGVLGGEYYHVPDVPWVMYFTNRGHAIHGAYWHDNFGQVMSHGCINLPVSTAEWLYSVSPLGTRIRIHY